NGSITGLYTVLVDQDDLNDPIADALRSILDGHIVLSRELAQRNHFPAIDVLGSVSRLMPDVAGPEHRELAARGRELLAAYREVEDLINIGAYEQGSNPLVDEAIAKRERIMSFLRQGVDEFSSLQQTLEMFRFALE
ncbi:MAG: EscN/YscN/HrcN family type III secretion system ATPase, partial [Clostridia bacterium]|nr:EscN/YscN/HrcN family type III secretion system ATPase [Clostridia bacterium]